VPCQRALDHAFLTIIDAIVAAARDLDQQHGKRESRVILQRMDLILVDSVLSR